MNIKIPYKLLGNVGDIEFVSFILDKNEKSIHRNDIRPKDTPLFFNKKQEYLQVDDKL